jgi:hypothetical protein
VQDLDILFNGTLSENIITTAEESQRLSYFAVL